MRANSVRRAAAAGPRRFTTKKWAGILGIVLGLIAVDPPCGEQCGPVAVLTDAAGAPIADMLDGDGYGVLNRGRTRTRAMGALFQIIDDRPMLGGRNHFALGLSYDTSRTRFDTSVELGALTDARSVDAKVVDMNYEGGLVAFVYSCGSQAWQY